MAYLVENLLAFLKSPSGLNRYLLIRTLEKTFQSLAERHLPHNDS